MRATRQETLEELMKHEEMNTLLNRGRIDEYMPQDPRQQRSWMLGWGFVLSVLASRTFERPPAQRWALRSECSMMRRRVCNHRHPCAGAVSEKCEHLELPKLQ